MFGLTSFALALLMLGLVGCSGGETGSSGPASTTQVSPPPGPGTPAEGADDETEPTAEVSAPSEDAPDPPAPEGPTVDLLRAAATRVHVSSVYEEDEARARQLADGRLETAWPARFGLELDSRCDPLMVTDVLVSVACTTTEYEDAGNTERVSVYHLEVVGGRVRAASLTGFFVDGTTLDDLLASVPSTQRTRHMSCTGDCDSYAAALGGEGVVVVDEQGEPFHTVPYETLRGRLRGEGTLATLFARSDEE